MNSYAVLAEGFEHLSYPLGRVPASEGAVFYERNERFVMLPANSHSEAEMAVASADSLSEHASFPVGLVADSNGRVFIVCRPKGRFSSAESGALLPSGMPAEERVSFCRTVIRRLAMLHTGGFCCGGISPGEVEFSGGEAKLLNPSKISAASDSDPLYYEAVATLRSLYGSGFARKSELGRLAQEYVSYSPVSRHAVLGHLAAKGARTAPAKALCEHALRLAAYF